MARPPVAADAPPTGELAAFVRGLSEGDIPEHVRERVKDLLIDSVACAFAAGRAEEIGQVEAFADVLESAVPGGPPGRRSLAAATMVAAYRITALTACDAALATSTSPRRSCRRPWSSPGSAPLSGRDLLVAVAAGLEVATRVAAGLDYPSFRARGSAHARRCGAIRRCRRRRQADRPRHAPAAQRLWARGEPGSRDVGCVGHPDGQVPPGSRRPRRPARRPARRDGVHRRRGGAHEPGRASCPPTRAVAARTSSSTAWASGGS